MARTTIILPQLYFTEEPIFGRVLRTKQSHEIGDLIFQESPIVTFKSGRDLTSEFKSYLYEFTENYSKEQFELCNVAFITQFPDVLVNIILNYLQLNNEIRSNVLEHFYHESTDSAKKTDEFSNMLYDIVLCVYNEIKKQLNNKFITEKVNYNCNVTDIQEFIDLYDIYRLNVVEGENSNSHLYFNYALMKHDCKPNVVASIIENGVNSLYAVDTIKPHDALTIYYTKKELILYPNLIRRQYLNYVKQFWCHCNLCDSDDTSCPLKCPNEGCDGYMYLSIKRLGWECRNCLSKFDGCRMDESNINNVIPIIRREFELVKNFLILYITQYPNPIITQPCLSLNDAAIKAEEIKAIVGERHSLYMLNYRSYLHGITNKDSYDGIVASLRAILITAKWISITLHDDEYRKISGLNIVVNQLKNLLDENSWEVYQSYNETSSIIEIIHILQLHFPVNQPFRFIKLNQIDSWLLKCCSACGKIVNNLMKCSCCLKVCYCDKDCQKKDLKRHNAYCIPRKRIQY